MRFLKMRMRPGFLGLMVVLAMLLVACAEPVENNMPPLVETPIDETQTGEVEIFMAGSMFSPREVTIEAGTTVLWYNDDTLPHTVTSDTQAGLGELFDAELEPGGNFSYTFDEPGDYLYVCTLHPGMEGVITVE